MQQHVHHRIYSKLAWALMNRWYLDSFDRCEDLGLIEIKPGTTTSDVECGQKVQVALIVIIIACIVVVLAVVGLYLKMRRKCNRNIGKCFILIYKIYYIPRKYWLKIVFQTVLFNQLGILRQKQIQMKMYVNL